MNKTLPADDWAAGRSATDWRAAQAEQLQWFVRHTLYPHSPHYRRLFDENKIDPRSLRSVADLRRVPFTSKTDLLSTPHQPEKFRDFILQPDVEKLKRQPAVVLRALLRGRKTVQRELERQFRPIFLTATTGRSSAPVGFLYTHHDLHNWLQCGKRLIQTFGAAPRERGVNVFPFAPHLAFWQVAFAGIEFGLLLVHTGGGKVLGTETNIALIEKLKPEVLIGMPTYLYHLLTQAHETKHRWPSINKIVLGGEKAPPGLRHKMVELLQNMGAECVQILSTYGFTEAKTAWGECPSPLDSPSGFHLYPDKEIIEIVDPQTGEPVGEGQPGDIIYSSIDARGSVVFRYRTGDYTKRGVTWEPCPHCGRRGPRLLGPIGRSSNVKDLKLDKIKGTLVNFNELEHILSDDAQVAEWQLEIRKVNDDPLQLDELVLHLCLTRGADPEQLKQRVCDKFLQRAELRPNHIEFHDLEDMRKRIKLETSLKEVRILDSRPKP